MHVETELVTINEATTLANVSRRTIYNWLTAGKLQYRRTAGGAVRIVASSLFREGNVAIAKPEDDAA